MIIQEYYLSLGFLFGTFVLGWSSSWTNSVSPAFLLAMILVTVFRKDNWKLNSRRARAPETSVPNGVLRIAHGGTRD